MSNNVQATMSADKNSTNQVQGRPFMTPQKDSNKENRSYPANVNFSDYKPTLNEFQKNINKVGSKDFKLSYMFNVHASSFKPTQNMYDDNRETRIVYLRDNMTQEPRLRRETNDQQKISPNKMTGYA